MSTAPRRRKRPSTAKGKLDRYAVKLVPIDSIKPSPENEDIYGAIELDTAMENLIDSIRRKGLEPHLPVSERPSAETKPLHQDPRAHIDVMTSHSKPAATGATPFR